eukprot:3141191-Rhodomonas_salina.3
MPPRSVLSVSFPFDPAKSRERYAKAGPVWRANRRFGARSRARASHTAKMTNRNALAELTASSPPHSCLPNASEV